MTIKTAVPKAPAHLCAETRGWFDQIIRDYELESHHVRLLSLACGAWDRGVTARQEIDKHGLTIEDRFGMPRPRPEVAIERDARLAFARLCRELDLDAEPPPATTRPPALRSNR